MKTRILATAMAAFAIATLLCNSTVAAAVPLPEHPRPDFERADWVNLNGTWQFRFDKENAGEGAGWSAGKAEFPERITVPFPWGSKLSGLENKADIGWGSQIRSYVLDQSRVKDLRTNLESARPQNVLDGDLDEFLQESLKQGL